jgi:hypothetical protein
LVPVHNRVAGIPDPNAVGGFVNFTMALAIQGPIVPVQIEIPNALAEQFQKKANQHQHQWDRERLIAQILAAHLERVKREERRPVARRKNSSR